MGIYLKWLICCYAIEFVSTFFSCFSALPDWATLIACAPCDHGLFCAVMNIVDLLNPPGKNSLGRKIKKTNSFVQWWNSALTQNPPSSSWAIQEHMTSPPALDFEALKSDCRNQDKDNNNNNNNAFIYTVPFKKTGFHQEVKTRIWMAYVHIHANRRTVNVPVLWPHWWRQTHKGRLWGGFLTWLTVIFLL